MESMNLTNLSIRTAVKYHASFESCLHSLLRSSMPLIHCLSGGAIVFVFVSLEDSCCSHWFLKQWRNIHHLRQTTTKILKTKIPDQIQTRHSGSGR